MSKITHLRIGELAKQTGLTVGNIRYYSDLGLLQPVQRGDNGYRYGVAELRVDRRKRNLFKS